MTSVFGKLLYDIDFIGTVSMIGSIIVTVSMIGSVIVTVSI